MKDFLFPKPTESNGFSLLLLAFRIFFGLMLMMHGVDKLFNYKGLYYSFPDPTGMGSELSLLFVIFAELVCSIGFIVGVLYRLCMIPMLIVMATAFFHVHEGSIIHGEMSFIYLIVLIIMYISGPGKFSVDAKIHEQIHQKDYEAYEY